MIKLIIHACTVIPITAVLFYLFLKYAKVPSRLVQRSALLAVISYLTGWFFAYLLVQMGINAQFGIIASILVIGLLLSYFLVLPKFKVWLASVGIIIGGQFLAVTIVLTILNNINAGP